MFQSTSFYLTECLEKQILDFLQQTKGKSENVVNNTKEEKDLADMDLIEGCLFDPSVNLRSHFIQYAHKMSHPNIPC